MKSNINFLSLDFVSLGIAVLSCLFFWSEPVRAEQQSIEKICQESAVACIKEINATLPTLPEKSRVWYSLIVLKLDALHSMQKIHDLYQLTSAWLDEENLPLHFQTNIYIYYAKASHDMGEEEQALVYIRKAKEKILLMNEAYPSPKLVLELASLQSYLDDQTESYKSLVELEKQYRDRATPYYQVEIYGHLGHSARKLGYLDKELFYWKKSVEWAYVLGYDRQIAITLYNYGQAQQKSSLFKEAKQTYLDCIRYAENANNLNKIYQAKIHLVELALHENNLREAKRIFKEIKVDSLAQRFKDTYQELGQKL